MPPKERKPSPRNSSSLRSSRSSHSSKPTTSGPRAREKSYEVFIILLLVLVLMNWLLGLFRGDFLKRFSSPFSSVSSLQDIRTPIGGDISLSTDSEIFSFPGGPSLGTQQKGAKGVVAGGPEVFNGERYWFVDFAAGPDGWVPESVLRSGNGGVFDPGDTPVGSGVRSRGDTEVRSSPGGPSIGIQAEGARGVITKGPEYANGERFWYVDFASGPDGWVLEKDIELQKEDSLFSKIWGGIVGSFKLISTILSLLFLTGIIYSVIRVGQVNAEEHKKEKQKESPVYAASAAQEHANRRWERVLTHAQTQSPADWRLALPQGDIMLAELLDRMGYIGENVGEKLKRIEQSDFNSIDDAWEAHKVRNLIAHQGSDYVLSQREAQRVIGLYANVFREFRYI